MSNLEAHDQLSAYLDGELTDAETAELEAELARDAALREELEAVRGVIRLLRQEGPVDAPMGFHHKVMARVEDEALPFDWWAWLRRPFGLPLEGLAVAAVAAAVLLLAIPWQGDSSPEESATDAAPAAVDPTPMKPDGEADAEPQGKQTQKGQQAEPAPPPSQPLTKGDPAPVIQSKLPEPQAEQSAEGTGEAEGDPTLEVPPPAVAAGEADEAQADPVLRSVGYSYVIRTDDPEALLALHRIAASYEGALTNEDLEPLQSTALGADPTSVLVRLPATALADFSGDLAGLGVVASQVDKSLFSGEEVQVRVTIEAKDDGPMQADQALESL